MERLLEDNPGQSALLLGNRAIVRGAIEAGLEAAAAYPGTPSTEIADTLYALSKVSDLRFEYSTNEKVALEVAAGSALAGMRSLCCMKHVGLNVAADPLNTLAYTGVRAGMVIVTADDPSMHSSQNEQDNRFYAKLSLLPMLEPSDPAEAYELTRKAFALSEELESAVLLRTTTRVNHTRGVCTFGDLTARRFQGHFDKDPMRFAPVPAVAKALRTKQLERLDLAYDAMRRLGVDRLEGEGDLAVITAGVAWAYVQESLDDLGLRDQVRVLKIASLHPLPRDLIEEVLDQSRRVLVVEELEPYLETEIRAMAQQLGAEVEIRGKVEGWIPRAYELDVDRVRPAVARLADREVEEVGRVRPGELPSRPPMLCAGCPHRSTYYAVKSVVGPDTYFPSDIGCYTLGIQPPLSTADAFLCMGSSITLASGTSIRNPQDHVAFIGDSTFFHSGITGLVNAVHNRHDLLLVILDNSTTAMTGHQPHPGATVDGERHDAVSIDKLIRGLAVTDVQVVDPANVKETMEAVRGALDRSGVRVIISRHPCPLFERRILGDRTERPVYRVDHDRCKVCGRSGKAEPCGAPLLKDDELLRARARILAEPRAPIAGEALCRSGSPRQAPCTMACPAGVCVQGYMSLTRAGRYREALELIREQVLLPLTLGLVCHHPCEAVCTRAAVDEPVAACDVKRFLAERETDEERQASLEARRAVAHSARPARGERVAVVGAGPAGLAAAQDLTIRGYEVTLFDREQRPGGLLATGIPVFRLPRNLLDKEVEAILSLGIAFEGGRCLGEDLSVEGLLADDFDAVCLALGAHRGRRLGCPGEDAAGVEDALCFLRRVAVDDDKEVGHQVLVIGGGDAAMDGARTALRLGAESVRIVYRRAEEDMPAAAAEREEALAEGVQILARRAPMALEIDGDRLVGLRIQATKPGEPDPSGRARPEHVPGTEELLEADHVILALGQEPETSCLAGEETPAALRRAGAVEVNPETGATADPRVFAAGDVTAEGWTVVAAIAQGRRAAHGIDLFLGGEEAAPAPQLNLGRLMPSHEVELPPDMKPVPRARSVSRPAAERVRDLEVVCSGFDEAAARHEAERCLSCGTCGRCNNCIDNFGCPAITLREGLVHIDELLCVGCGVCAQLCPNGAIVPVLPRDAVN